MVVRENFQDFHTWCFPTYILHTSRLVYVCTVLGINQFMSEKVSQSDDSFLYEYNAEVEFCGVCCCLYFEYLYLGIWRDHEFALSPYHTK